MPVDMSAMEIADPMTPTVLRDAMADGGFQRVWAMGNTALFHNPLLGFFCSTRCPGEVILRTYDLARALRHARVTVIGGFHTPMEKECLDLLLRGKQPVVICPARSIERMELPAAWRGPMTEDRLLILSPFEAKERRPTIELAERRNRLVAALASRVIVAHATAGSRTEQLCSELMAYGKQVYTLGLAENAHMMANGIVGHSVGVLLQTIV
jgi:predicted Rossmann fold nucleotide-binding protein DprA/Smf involved in DNA uptake